MQKFNLQELIEYNDSKFNPKVLVNEPGYRMVLLNLRKGQSVPEHANKSAVTVYALAGHITFYEGTNSCELRAGEVVSIGGGAPHHLEAHEDSALYVLAAGQIEAVADASEELDLREVPRPMRHPMVFAKLDALPVGGSFVLVNDHDPVPLSRQIESMRQGQAAWEYLQRGPDLFRIRIKRVAPSAAAEIPVKAQSEAIVAGIGTA
jgi:uncharacterized protein (DUF2249 family)/mannose-6-phosphate isomerase-like protein (cupin superfamily)